MQKLYLSRRNIAILLEKLDSVRDGEASASTIIKNEVAHPVYPQTMRRIAVTAVEAQDRYWNEVSQRLHLSRPTLVSLLEQLNKQAESAVDIDGVLVLALPDEQYYVDQSQADYAPAGDLGSAFIRSRGRQR